MVRHSCFCPPDLDRGGAIGTRFPCKTCGKGLILGPGTLLRSKDLVRYVHEICTPKDSITKREPCTWTLGREGKIEYVYVRCCLCANILKTTTADVDKNGFIVPAEDADDGPDYHCLHCDCCGIGNYPYLEGWKEAIEERRKHEEDAEWVSHSEDKAR